MTGAVALLVVLSMLPSRWLQPLYGLSAIAQMLPAPVQFSVSRAVMWLRPRPPGADVITETEKQLRADLAEQGTRLLQAELRVDQLERELDQLRAVASVAQQANMRPVLVSVLGPGTNPSSLEFVVKGGTRDGLIRDAIVVNEGVQIVGRVVEAGPVQSRVRPINDAAAGSLTVRIFPGQADVKQRPDALATSVAAFLSPDKGSGLLVGDVGDVSMRPDMPGVAPERGMLVRLDDNRWPRHAQMMIVGEIESVETKPNQRLSISVRPRFDLSRLPGVTVLVPREAAGTPQGPAGPKGNP